MIHNVLKETINRTFTPQLTKITKPISDENEFAVPLLFSAVPERRNTLVVDKLI